MPAMTPRSLRAGAAVTRLGVLVLVAPMAACTTSNDENRISIATR